MRSVDKKSVLERLPKRSPEAHKGSMGTLCCVCGSYGMAGACMLSAGAALRSGVGLVRIAAVRSVYPILSSALPEAVFTVLDDEEYLTMRSLSRVLNVCNGADAALVGCGLGGNVKTVEMLNELIAQITVPMLIDADGINAVSQHIFVLNRLQSEDVVITPHPKEMARLTKKSVAQIQDEREKTAVDFAEKFALTVLLKGHRTVIAASRGESFINTTGNSGLATGGSGDVLAGIISSLMAQGMSGEDAAVCGAYIHGKNADILARKTSQSYLLPQDLVKGMYLWEKE